MKESAHTANNEFEAMSVRLCFQLTCEGLIGYRLQLREIRCFFQNVSFIVLI